MSASNKNDLVALITGAGRGVGRSTAIEIGRSGASVLVNDINPDSAAETVRQVNEVGGRAIVHITDISKKFPVQALVNAVEDEWGRLDILVNNAHVLPHKALLDMDEWDWRRTLDVNLTGAFLLTQVAGRVMRQAGGGFILHMVETPGVSNQQAAAIAAAQGILGMVNAARDELQEIGVRLEAVAYRENEKNKAVETVRVLVEDWVKEKNP